ncbi:hypothetical protein ACGFIV_04675 [Sphaerisporangium sp. NPDC049003]|uniref:hypothetical protein n=1 Tax=Sphaerisporangium sp. NPDC049003 TaxID=3364517 RepID=UPI0037142AE0
MTAAPNYQDLHALVDQLRPDQAQELRAVALRLVKSNEAAEELECEQRSRRRRLSFIGTMNSGAGDLAERHEEIIREGLAERLGLREVATLDHRHFRVVRPRHVPAFDLLP